MRINKLNVYMNEFFHPYLVKESATNYTAEETLNTPQKIADMLNAVFMLNKQAVEQLYLIAMNSNSKPTGVFMLSQGAINKSMVSQREIILNVILAGGCNFIIAHNHPSGNPKPSKEDISITKTINEAAKLMGLNLLDHIIVGGNSDSYTSLREQGYL